MRNNVNLIGYWVNLSRAYEIALLGDFSIQIMYDMEYNAINDYKLIKEFFNRCTFCFSGDLIVKIYRPQNLVGLKRGQFETIKDINKRVENAKRNTIPTEYDSKSCEQLLKVAIDRLDLDLKTIGNIERIAKVISQLEGTEKIQAQHLAEAIQYNVPESGINAESQAKTFGGITIPLAGLEAYDIQEAINYLQSLLI